MRFYNTRHMAQPGTLNRMNSDLSVLTKVALADVQMRCVSSIHGLSLQVGESVNDPVYQLMQTGGGAAEIAAGWGVKVELAFSMGMARIVAPVQRARDTRAGGRILRESREVV
jgi:hypothetical protein